MLYRYVFLEVFMNPQHSYFIMLQIHAFSCMKNRTPIVLKANDLFSFFLIQLCERYDRHVQRSLLCSSVSAFSISLQAPQFTGLNRTCIPTKKHYWYVMPFRRNSPKCSKFVKANTVRPQKKRWASKYLQVTQMSSLGRAAETASSLSFMYLLRKLLWIYRNFLSCFNKITKVLRCSIFWSSHNGQSNLQTVLVFMLKNYLCPIVASKSILGLCPEWKRSFQRESFIAWRFPYSFIHFKLRLCTCHNTDLSVSFLKSASRE